LVINKKNTIFEIPNVYPFTINNIVVNGLQKSLYKLLIYMIGLLEIRSIFRTQYRSVCRKIYETCCFALCKRLKDSYLRLIML